MGAHQENMVAIYCRLSKEDFGKEDTEDSSESIKNQIAMLREYAKEKNWIIYNTYIDEDFSGSDRNREGFNKMITDALSGNFGIILCKKQARFARDLELVEKYIHGIFIEKGIRFVAMLDNIDTASNNTSYRKTSQINGLVDQWYLQDLSENVKSSFDIKRKNGEFIGSFAPYGYCKDPHNKNHLLLDPEASEVVKEIYKLYIGGNGITSIAQILNNRGILNPLTYKLKQGEKINPNPSSATSKRHLWSPSTISNILHNEIYIGNMVQGKYKKPNYKSNKLLRQRKSEWFIVENTHEPIIDLEQFQKVQSLLGTRSRVCGNQKNHHLFTGKVYCGECGCRLTTSGGFSGKDKTRYLCCSKRNLKKEDCIGSRIQFVELEKQVLERYHLLSHQYFDQKYLQNHIDTHCILMDKSIIKSTKDHISKYKQKIVEINNNIQQMYLDKLNGVISLEEFLSFRNKILEEKESILKQQIHFQEELDRKKNPQVDKEELIKNYENINNLTREIIQEFVDSIYIFHKNNGVQKIEINWKI